MRRVLLTGMSGTGKSAVVGGLVARGLRAVDTDYGWCETAPPGEWIWNECRIQELLSNEYADVLFVAGCASNQGKFYDQFDLVILLSAPPEVMIARVENRTGNHFGKSPDELSRILTDLDLVEPRLRSVAHAEIRTDRPLDQILDEVIAHSKTK